jgi:hypothetical protein
MNKQIEFNDNNGKFYALKINNREIKLDAYSGQQILTKSLDLLFGKGFNVQIFC